MREKRHFHTGFGEPSVADPCGEIRIVETSTERDPLTGEARYMNYWTGWRATLANWLIDKLLPVERQFWRKRTF